MAPSRGKGKSRASARQNDCVRASRSTRTTRNAPAPDVYQEMLAEEAKRSSEVDLTDRPLKRRRVATGVQIASSSPAAHQEGAQPASSPTPIAGPTGRSTQGKSRAKPIQTVETSSDDDSGNESDLAFEDIDLSAGGPASATEENDGIADVSVSIDPSTAPKPSAPIRRKPATSAEKALKLVAHKAHILCLLGHCMYVNTWCNDINVQQHLHPLLSKKTLNYLQGKDEWTQFQRDRVFREALEHASEALRAHFRVNASGLRRTTASVDDKVESTDDIPSTSRQDLIKAAREMEGSQDTGNQLFCSLLRSAGVDTRLVCSIQPLSLNTTQPKSATPQKTAKPVVRAMPPYADPATSDSNTEDSTVQSSSTIGKVPSARRRLGQPSLKAAPAPFAPPPPRKKTVRKLDYPIFWVEAFNTAHQKWTAVDPLVTHAIGKPSKFEPPSSYALNQMSYVIAFEEDGVVRDVTRRYTKAYIAKTRHNRVESTDNGTQWFKKALRHFRRRDGALDRDQTEDAELNQREAREGLPGNVQDFKDHPVYALERHLKRQEVIAPKREVGKVNAGTAAKPRMEPVYRRSDVLICRSADKWYRLGRVIQPGEAPIKHVPARVPGRGRSRSPDTAGDEFAVAGMTPLYAQYQTEAYIAPPVVEGKVPRNAFGNLDIYVPSMVPPGGIHIRHALAQQAARILRVHYADAVTGFRFKGRHGTAIVQGAIVPAENSEAVQAVIDSLLNEKLEEESLARSGVALRMWKRFLTGLRIKERVGAYGTDDATKNEVREELDRQVGEQDEIAEAGGFFAEEPAMPTAGKFSLVEMARAVKQTNAVAKKARQRKEQSESESEEEAEFSGADEDDVVEESSVPARRSKRVKRIVPDEDDEDEDEDDDDGMIDSGSPPGVRSVPMSEQSAVDQYGGGFVNQDSGEDDQGAGFVLEDDGDEYAGGFLPEDGSDAAGFIFEEGASLHHFDGIGTGDGEGGFLPDAQIQDQHASGFVPRSSLDGEHTPAVPPGDPSHVLGANSEAVSYQTSTPALDQTALDKSLKMHGAFAAEEQGLRDRNEDASEVTVHDERPPESTTAIISMDIETTGPSVTTDSDILGKAGSEPEEEQRDDQSDHGSMLSHDPDDEDAEPDWLESD